MIARGASTESLTEPDERERVGIERLEEGLIEVRRRGPAGTACSPEPEPVGRVGLLALRMWPEHLASRIQDCWLAVPDLGTERCFGPGCRSRMIENCCGRPQADRAVANRRSSHTFRP